MTRRQLLGTTFLLPALRAQVRYREYGRCLPDYLTAIAEDAYARRNARLAQLTTPSAIREYQAWARRTFLQLAGDMPERTPLNLRNAGTLDRPAYRVSKLVYESRPGLVVTANLYVPKTGTPPYPGVLFQLGHATDGKSYGAYQRCCQGLAQLGYVVLSFDTMGQGERTNYPRPGGWLTRLGSADDEHTVPGRQMLLTGETSTGMQLWDAIRSLDVLAARPEVDPKRLASTGQSGGGTLTMMLAAVDDRLAVAAVSSGNTENVATVPFHSPGSTDDAEQDFLGSGPLAFDRWDLLYPFAPKPLLITVSARDFFGTYSPSYAESGREEFAKLAKIYPPDRLKFVDTPLPHGLSYAMRLDVYNWFERHLKNSTRPIVDEPPTAPETAETLWCGPTGNAVRDFNGKTPWMLTRERSRLIRTPDTVPDLRALLRVQPSPPSKLEVLGSTRYADCDIQAVEVATAPKVWCPAWLFLPKKPWTKLVLVLEPNGRNGRWREGDLYHQLASSGIAVCAADIRGIGDLYPQYSSGAASYTGPHQSEENYAWSGLILGRPLLGQRVTDILAIVQALPQSATISIAARDKMTVPALCAAALDKRVASLYLSHPLESWRSLIESETYSHPLANFVPNVLRETDLPQIARSIAPRPIVTGDAWDAAALSRI
jgi:cephalosporin-C deacetylase-like acetyl esterase